MEDRTQWLIEEAPEPPSAPEVARSVRFSRPQIVALIVLSGVTFAALAGAFNQQKDETQVLVGGVDVRVSYTTLSRLQQTEIVSVMVSNGSGAPVDSVYVAVDTGYMASFSDIAMVPQPAFPYGTHLVDVPVGAEREVRVSARGGQAGRHHGVVTIGVRGDTARVSLSTFILP